MSQLPRDAMALLLPPDALCDWLATVIAARLNNGERVPAAYTRWLYRVNMLRLNIPMPALQALTADEWNEIEQALMDADKTIAF